MCQVPRFSRPVIAATLAVALTAGCQQPSPPADIRFSGYVEATDVRVAAEVGGRLAELRVEEGARVSVGDIIARLETTDTELSLRRAEADRGQAEAQLRLVRAGFRDEEVRQAEAQVAVAESELSTSRIEASSAQIDLDRYDDLLRRSSGSRKQRDDAATRAEVTAERVKAAEQRVRAAREVLQRFKAGARVQEIDVAQRRVVAADAQIDTLREALADATVAAPSSGIVTQKLVEPGELLAPRAPLVVITDLERAWATVYVDEPTVPRIRLGQSATIFTDAGGAGLPGTVSHVSPRAEFTPRNVQTAEERSKLVYRVKISTNNSSGLLKPGMPVEARIALDSPPAAAPTTSDPKR